MKKRLITAALPYVNNIPHLGNLIQVLSADVFARYCRLRSYETLYICGTDEYGTTTETKAKEEGVSPQELCDRYYALHAEIYDFFNISFDKFGRSSDPVHRDFTQSIFTDIYEQGHIREKTSTQLYSEKSQMFLADRYIKGICPHCGYEEARGDQCENCGKLLDPMDLKDVRSLIDDSTPIPRQTQHLYINLPALASTVESWMKSASLRGDWAKNAIKMTEAWFRDGLKERAITRDLRWGIPVPLKGYREKVFYVWFDAPIGYISITASLRGDWKEWWMNPENVCLFQFVGKDNIPFHSVLFPAALIATKKPWTLVHHISSSEYLTYAGKNFSKSRNIGIFADQAQQTGIPHDVWRFYLMRHRPESSDYHFTWKDFQLTTNSDLIGNISNFFNRILRFSHKYFPSHSFKANHSDDFWTPVRKSLATIEECLEKVKLSMAVQEILKLSDHGNRCFQEAEPWNLRRENPEAVKALLGNLLSLARDLALVLCPFIPESSKRIFSFLGLSFPPQWTDLMSERIFTPSVPQLLFSPIEDDLIASFERKFSGKKESKEDIFATSVDLRVARVLSVLRHPQADKLYLLDLDDGTGDGRRIVSGLVGYYSEEELKDLHIVIVANLKATRIRGEKSNGMLLATSQNKSLELLLCPHADPGSPVVLEGVDDVGEREKISRLSIDSFLEVAPEVRDHTVYVGQKALCCKKKHLQTQIISHGLVS